MENTYIWSHHPSLSSSPKERKLYVSFGKGQEIEERAVYELENGKFLYILFYGHIDNPKNGVTDLEECDTYEEALELFK